LVTFETSFNQFSEYAPELEGTNPLPTPVDRLTEVILHEVQAFRQTQSDRVEVVLKPDNQTEISIEFRFHNGEVEASARCQRGDFPALTAQWSQLQQTLSQHGVRLTELEGSNFLGQSSPGPFSQDQRDSYQRTEDPREGRFSENRPKALATTEPQRPGRRNQAYSVRHLVDSWA
jgi:hypothetical protein